jgi:hypothetical protein
VKSQDSGDISSLERCGPPSAPIGVEEYQPVEAQPLVETGFRNGIPLGATHAICSNRFLCLRRSLLWSIAYFTDLVHADVLHDDVLL